MFNSEYSPAGARAPAVCAGCEALQLFLELLVFCLKFCDLLVDDANLLLDLARGVLRRLDLSDVRARVSELLIITRLCLVDGVLHALVVLERCLHLHVVVALELLEQALEIVALLDGRLVLLIEALFLVLELLGKALKVGVVPFLALDNLFFVFVDLGLVLALSQFNCSEALVNLCSDVAQLFAGDG